MKGMKWVVGILCIIFSTCFLVGIASAAEPQSTHYHFSESTLGSGGLNQESSTNFQAGEFIGDLAVGNSASSNFQIYSGFDTTADPSLSFIVDSGTINFGSFSPSVAATTTSTFEVIDYTSYGYIVQIYGSPPTNGSHTITPMAVNNPSQVGTEQFGINLVSNISPVSFGANPNNGISGFGQAATNYNTANNYRYVSGETIATGPKSSGLTIYTISYIVNVTSVTPGGQYTSNQTLVCIGTF